MAVEMAIVRFENGNKIKLSATILIAHAPAQIQLLLMVIIMKKLRKEQKYVCETDRN